MIMQMSSLSLSRWHRIQNVELKKEKQKIQKWETKTQKDEDLVSIVLQKK